MCPSYKDARQERSSRRYRGGSLQGSPIKNVFGCKSSHDLAIKRPVNTYDFVFTVYSASGRLLIAPRTSGCRWPSGENAVRWMAHGEDIWGSNSKPEGSTRRRQWWGEWKMRLPECFNTEKPVFIELKSMFALEGIFNWFRNAQATSGVVFWSKMLRKMLRYNLSLVEAVLWLNDDDLSLQQEESMLCIYHVLSCPNALQMGKQKPRLWEGPVECHGELVGGPDLAWRILLDLSRTFFSIPVYHGVQIRDLALAYYTETDNLGFDIWHILRILAQNLSSSVGTQFWLPSCMVRTSSGSWKGNLDKSLFEAVSSTRLDLIFLAASL